MSETFTKLFSSITDSTIWSQDNETRLVWITMLAMADQNGYVGASVDGLARRANVSLDATERALAAFLSPDTRSRSQEQEGRRIAVAERGWTLINYRRFRELRDEDVRREGNRLNKRAQRQREKLSKTSQQSHHGQPSSAQADQIRSEADQKEDTDPSASPRAIDYPQAFALVWESTGRHGLKAKAFKAWKAKGKPDWPTIQAPWLAYLLSERPAAGFVQDLSTWINNSGWQQEWPRATQKPQVDRTPQWQREREAQGQREAQALQRQLTRDEERPTLCGYHLYAGEDAGYRFADCPKKCPRHGQGIERKAAP